jgi:hypothetical protein
VVTGTSIRLVAHLFANPRHARHDPAAHPDPDRSLPPAAAGRGHARRATLYYERRLNEISALIDPPAIVPSDARLDFEKWGSWLQGGTVVRFTNNERGGGDDGGGHSALENRVSPRRRRYIYDTQVVGRGGEIPLPQTGAGRRPTTHRW